MVGGQLYRRLNKILIVVRTLTNHDQKMMHRYIDTEYWNDIRCRGQSFTNNQQEDDESEQNCDLQVDLVTRLDGKKETEKRHSVDEKAR